MMTEEWKRRGQEAAEQARQMQQRARAYEPEKTSCLPLTPPPLTRRHPEPEAPSQPETGRTDVGATNTGLSADPDRALLLLLIVLLLKNSASMELILALCYLAL